MTLGSSVKNTYKRPWRYCLFITLAEMTFAVGYDEIV